jgi:predicted ATPase
LKYEVNRVSNDSVFFISLPHNYKKMEKLIVKNFGPIKEAEIDLTKYVVFIGDTSTGKSVLAKLIAIFRDSFIILSIQKEMNSIDIIKELKKYNINFITKKTEISYFQSEFITKKLIKVLELNDNKIKLTNNEFKSKMLDTIELFQNKSLDKLIFPDYINFNKNKFIETFYNDLLRNVNSTYFPAERILYSLTSNSISGLMANNVALPECYKDFAAKYEVARSEINFAKYNLFDIEYNYENGLDEITIYGNKILLKEASSGIQSIIPLLIVIEKEIKNIGISSKNFIIEEPEINLYPSKQKNITEYIIAKTASIDVNLVITTHSPYILSTLDTLILSKNTFNEHPELKKEISEIISENKWIDYNDISVYEVKNDGTLHSIKNEEFKSIDSNAIDSVSDIISEEYDKLIALRYAD